MKRLPTLKLPIDYPYQVPDLDLAMWHFDLLAGDA